jgi:L-alanine-DL-glutamate epimerase-like enolase superfamily enzyme
MIIEKIEMYRLKVPLKRPYKIASAEMKAFDCTIVCLQAQNRQGIGEAMSDVRGYFWETPEEVWQFAREMGKRIMRLTPARAYQEVSIFSRRQPCAATPFLTAIEVLSGNAVLTPPSQTQLVPMVGILQAEEKGAIDEEIKTFITQGYDTLKVKVGFDVDKDIDKVRITQEATQGKALIRLDANQGYNLSQARKLVRNIDPQKIEFLEQPFKEKEWDAMVELVKVSPIPLGLDESIYGIEAVERTRLLNCARFVKFKIMKLGSADALVEGIETAKRYGLEVILGNGAAGEINCYHEALISGKMVTRAGEMNGFLKQKESILTEGFKIQGGKFVLEPQFSLRLDPRKMDRFVIDSLFLP